MSMYPAFSLRLRSRLFFRAAKKRVFQPFLPILSPNPFSQSFLPVLPSESNRFCSNACFSSQAPSAVPSLQNHPSHPSAPVLSASAESKNNYALQFHSKGWIPGEVSSPLGEGQQKFWRSAVAPKRRAWANAGVTGAPRRCRLYKDTTDRPSRVSSLGVAAGGHIR